MNEQELQQAFIQFLAQKTGAKNQQELEAVIQQLGEEGLKQAYNEFITMMQQQQVRAAKFGAKLNYIKQLRGQCPDGYETQYFKRGGSICKECVKKQQEVEFIPSDPVEAFKCGRKMTKKKKCENGSPIEMDKCGSKMKKKACGGSVEKDKCGNKMKKKACGGPVKKDQKGGTLSTAEPANERYKGGTYRGPRKLVDLRTGREVEGVVLPETEYIVGPDQTFNQPASMTLKYNSTGDSTITEVPSHFVNISGSWWLPNSVKIQPRTATNRGDNLQEWQTMKKRWEQAKKVTR